MSSDGRVIEIIRQLAAARTARAWNAALVRLFAVIDPDQATSFSEYLGRVAHELSTPTSLREPDPTAWRELSQELKAQQPGPVVDADRLHALGQLAQERERTACNTTGPARARRPEPTTTITAPRALPKAKRIRRPKVPVNVHLAVEHGWYESEGLGIPFELLPAIQKAWYKSATEAQTCLRWSRATAVGMSIFGSSLVPPTERSQSSTKRTNNCSTVESPVMTSLGTTA